MSHQSRKLISPLLQPRVYTHNTKYSYTNFQLVDFKSRLKELSKLSGGDAGVVHL